MMLWRRILSYSYGLIALPLMAGQSSSFQLPMRDPFASYSVPSISSDTKGVNAQLLQKPSLKNVSLNTVRYVGWVMQDQKTWGLVQTSNGVFVVVQVGDAVGPSPGVVKAIDAQNLMIASPLVSGQAATGTVIDLPLKEAL